MGPRAGLADGGTECFFEATAEDALEFGAGFERADPEFESPHPCLGEAVDDGLDLIRAALSLGDGVTRPGERRLEQGHDLSRESSRTLLGGKGAPVTEPDDRGNTIRIL